MDRELRRKLQDCLREIEASGDIESALRRHPRHAETLRPYLELASSLHSRAPAGPDQGDRLAGRQRLLAALAEGHQQERGVGQMTIFGRRLVPVIGSVLGAALLLGGIAGASALPGSPLPPPRNVLPFIGSGDADDLTEGRSEAGELDCEAQEEALEAQHDLIEEGFQGTEAEKEALKARHDAEKRALEEQCEAAGGVRERAEIEDEADDDDEHQTGVHEDGEDADDAHEAGDAQDDEDVAHDHGGDGEEQHHEDEDESHSGETGTGADDDN